MMTRKFGPPSLKIVTLADAGRYGAARAWLNEHWFTSLAHAQAVIETWRREYNDERPKRALGGLTPSQYAKQLAQKMVTVTAGL